MSFFLHFLFKLKKSILKKTEKNRKKESETIFFPASAQTGKLINKMRSPVFPELLSAIHIPLLLCRRS